MFRIDAQYFGKLALATEKQLKRGSWEELHAVARRVESFGAYALTNSVTYVDEGIPFLRCLNIKGGFADFTDVLYITAEAHELLWKSAVQPGMVLLTMSGSVGDAAVALNDWPYPLNSNQDVAKITPNSDINAFYLAAFLNSRYGRIQMDRLPVGSVQQHIFLWMIEKLIVARHSEGLEARIAATVKAAYEQRDRAQGVLKQAESVLLDCLGLSNWHPPAPLTFTRRASEVFGARRLDSTYFSPRVTELLARLGADNLRVGDVALSRHDDFAAGGDGEFDYIEISDVQSDGSAPRRRGSPVEEDSIQRVVD